MVCRFANGLKSLGVGKGDRVVIYMPLTIEGAVAMLACARIGAIHSVVYAGLGHTALQDRIVDAQAKVVIVGRCRIPARERRWRSRPSSTRR
jgi:acetyl-CoA synthetase